jgi:hypothetical protein
MPPMLASPITIGGGGGGGINSSSNSEGSCTLQRSNSSSSSTPINIASSPRTSLTEVHTTMITMPLLSVDLRVCCSPVTLRI